MNKFYGSMAYITCGNGCKAKFQRLHFNDNNQPYDTNWEELTEIYNNHNNTCTTKTLYTEDKNAFYGNPEDCIGFVNEGEFESGYKYCEF